MECNLDDLDIYLANRNLNRILFFLNRGRIRFKKKNIRLLVSFNLTSILANPILKTDSKYILHIYIFFFPLSS